jgi:hypothetical protein
MYLHSSMSPCTEHQRRPLKCPLYYISKPPQPTEHNKQKHHIHHWCNSIVMHWHKVRTCLDT